MPELLLLMLRMVLYSCLVLVVCESGEECLPIFLLLFLDACVYVISGLFYVSNGWLGIVFETVPLPDEIADGRVKVRIVFFDIALRNV